MESNKIGCWMSSGVSTDRRGGVNVEYLHKWPPFPPLPAHMVISSPQSEIHFMSFLIAIPHALTRHEQKNYQEREVSVGGVCADFLKPAAAGARGVRASQ